MKRKWNWNWQCTFTVFSFSVLSTLHHSTILKVGRTNASLAKSGNQHNTTATAKAGDVFLPGSLNLTLHESYSKCYVDPTRYEHHLEIPSGWISPVDHGLLYAPIPKAGSSNVKAKIEKSFGSKIKALSCRIKQPESIQVFTFVREPTSRFVSSFQETLKRWKMGEIPPEEYKEFAQRYRHIDLRKDHDDVLEALKRFFELYDAYQLPNIHFQAQITRILRPTCLPVDNIYNLENFDSVFGGFLAELGMNDTEVDATHIYTKPMRLDMTRVSADAKQKMCQMSAIDYCCLNFELPPECKGAVSCRWIEVTNEKKVALTFQPREGRKNKIASNDTVLMIEPISPYPMRPPQK